MSRNFYISADALNYMEKLNKQSGSGTIVRNLYFWWLCAQVGLLRNDANQVVNQPKDMVDHLNVGPIKNHQHIIRGILLMQHIRGVDAGKATREFTEGRMQHIFSGESASKLTEEGQKELDRYAASGFEYIKEEIGFEYDLKNFVRKYHDLIKKLTAEVANDPLPEIED